MYIRGNKFSIENINNTKVKLSIKSKPRINIKQYNKLTLFESELSNSRYNV